MSISYHLNNHLSSCSRQMVRQMVVAATIIPDVVTFGSSGSNFPNTPPFCQPSAAPPRCPPTRLFCCIANGCPLQLNVSGGGGGGGGGRGIKMLAYVLILLSIAAAALFLLTLMAVLLSEISCRLRLDLSKDLSSFLSH